MSARAKEIDDMPHNRATSPSDQPARSGMRPYSTSTAPNSTMLTAKVPNAARTKEVLYCIWPRVLAPTSRQ
jgi:hypothetical protein